MVSRQLKPEVTAPLFSEPYDFRSALTYVTCGLITTQNGRHISREGVCVTGRTHFMICRWVLTGSFDLCLARRISVCTALLERFVARCVHAKKILHFLFIRACFLRVLLKIPKQRAMFRLIKCVVKPQVHILLRWTSQLSHSI